MKYRPTTSCAFPSPAGARRFDASSRRAFWMLQQANT